MVEIEYKVTVGWVYVSVERERERGGGGVDGWMSGWVMFCLVRTGKSRVDS